MIKANEYINNFNYNKNKSIAFAHFRLISFFGSTSNTSNSDYHRLTVTQYLYEYRVYYVVLALSVENVRNFSNINN